MNESFSKDGRELVVEISKKDTELKAVQMAAYVLSDRAYVLIDETKSAFTAAFHLKDGSDARPLAALFARELASQKIRLALAESNRETMEYIASRALAPVVRRGADEAPLTQEQQDEIDRLISEAEAEIAELKKGGGASDGLGLMKTWEEKNQKSG